MLTRNVAARAALAFALGASLLGAPALAADGDQGAVQIGDLDFTSARDVAILDRRLRNAAREICGTVPARDFALQRAVSACHEEVMASARPGLQAAARTRGATVRAALRLR